MQSSRRRATWGILLGVVLGALGPQLVALSTESRNLVVEQGDLPAEIPARGNSYTNTLRAAEATWYYWEDDTLHWYWFVASAGVHHRSSSDGSTYDVAATEERRATAIRRICQEGKPCAVTRWTGADLLTFTDGPYRARFTGALRTPAGKSCTFDVRWTSANPPSAARPYPEGEPIPWHEYRTGDGRRFAESASAVLDSGCWEPLEHEWFSYGQVITEYTAAAGFSRGS